MHFFSSEMREFEKNGVKEIKMDLAVYHIETTEGNISEGALHRTMVGNRSLL